MNKNEQLEDSLDAIDDEVFDIYIQQLKSNQHLAAIGESFESIELASWKTAKQAALIRDNTEYLPDIKNELEALNETAMANLVTTALGAAISARQSEIIQEGFDEMISSTGDVEKSVDAMHSDMVDGNEEIITTQRETSEATICIAEEIQSMRVEQSKRFQVVAYVLRNLDANQERRHQELSVTILDTAKKRLAFEADEKYAFALQQFKAGDHKKAIQELRKALSAQSTHLQGLLLLGRISATEGNWTDAKDTYSKTARLALSSGDIAVYEAAILALAGGNKKEADELLKKAIDDWNGRNGKDKGKQDNAPVFLYYEFYKQSLFGMAGNIAKTKFEPFVEHLKYDDYTYQPYKPEVKIDISDFNTRIRDAVKNLVNIWRPKLSRIMRELDAECFRYEIQLARNDDELSFDDSSLFAFSKFKKAFNEEIKKIDVRLEFAFSADPYHSYFLDFELLDKLQAFINEQERALIGVISKRVCTRDWMGRDFIGRRWFYDGCGGDFKYDVTSTTRFCDAIRKEIHENFHGNFDYNMADHEEDHIDEFLSSSEYLKDCCFWLVRSLERHFTSGQLPPDKQRQPMRTVLSLYTNLLNLTQRFNGKNPKIRDKSDLINLRERMDAITSVITKLVFELDGHAGFLLNGRKKSTHK